MLQFSKNCINVNTPIDLHVFIHGVDPQVHCMHAACPASVHPTTDVAVLDVVFWGLFSVFSIRHALMAFVLKLVWPMYTQAA